MKLSLFRMMSADGIPFMTAVGLLPIAVAGCDIQALMDGAAQAAEGLCWQTLKTMTATSTCGLPEHPACGRASR